MINRSQYQREQHDTVLWNSIRDYFYRFGAHWIIYNRFHRRRKMWSVQTNSVDGFSAEPNPDVKRFHGGRETPRLRMRYYEFVRKANNKNYKLPRHVENQFHKTKWILRVTNSSSYLSNSNIKTLHNIQMDFISLYTYLSSYTDR